MTESNEYVGTYKQRCRECERRFTAAGSFCPYCGTPSPEIPEPPAREIRSDGGIDRCASDIERYILCENCEGHEDGWSVQVDENGEVTTVECRDCGGSDWYRRSW